MAEPLARLDDAFLARLGAPAAVLLAPPFADFAGLAAPVPALESLLALPALPVLAWAAATIWLN